ISGLPTPGDDVFGSAARFHDRLDGVRDLLRDTERSTVRLVVNPEHLVIEEARRTHTYLSLFGYHVDAVIVNRLLPEGLDDPFFDQWKRRHAEHLATIENGFAPVPVLRAHLADDEIIGLDALRSFGANLHADVEADPATILHEGDPMRIERVENGFELRIDLPFTDSEELELGRKGDELLIRVGSHRRALLLPDTLRHRSVGSANLRDGRLGV